MANTGGMKSAFIKKTVFNRNNAQIFDKIVCAPTTAIATGGTFGATLGTFIIDKSSGAIFLACAATGSGVITYAQVFVGTGAV